jgi:hypothetical protein
MEAGRPQPPGTTPPAHPPPPPATPPPAEPRADSAGAGPRILAVLGGLVWGIMGIALVVVGFDIVDAPLCSEPEEIELGEECYDGSSTQRFFDLLFGFPAGILGIAAAGLAVYFAATGRRGRLLVLVGIAALVLFGGSLLVGAF